MIISGQFQGPIAPTTPTACSDSSACTSPSSTITSGSSGGRRVARSHAEQAPTSNRAFGPFSGLPCSRESSRASSSAFASIASAAASRRALRASWPSASHSRLGGARAGDRVVEIGHSVNGCATQNLPRGGIQDLATFALRRLNAIEQAGFVDGRGIGHAYLL